MYSVTVTADDYGLTRGISESIMAAANGGALGQVSIMANGADFERAATALRERPALSIAVHLNLTEGRPILPACDVPHLVDKRGVFAYSFMSLFFSSLFARGVKRRALSDEIRRECEAQIARVLKALPSRSLSLNGHEHAHLIPLVFDAALAAAKGRVLSVRLVREPFSLRPLTTVTLRHVLGPNLLKHILLNVLSRRARPRAAEVGFSTPDAFIGVLHTGAVEENGIEALAQKLSKETRTLEILFHPGTALPGEVGNLRRSSSVWHYSVWRAREAKALESPAFARFLSKLRA